jgi:ElaB/YqjD/DUF883 family membrane-anchored ribosome-binding protein
LKQAYSSVATSQPQRFTNDNGINPFSEDVAMKTNTETQTEALKNAAHLKAGAAAAVAHDFIDRAADRLGKSEEKLRDTATAAQQTVAASLQGARTRLNQTNLAAQSYAQQHPLRALGVAVGVGALIALMLRKKPATPK